MSDGIPQELVDEIMVRCGRRCCICRHFKPTMLQVHHIRERASGGTDDLDNLIVVCFTCHVGTHSRVPFARRFTENEQKRHREELIRAVHEGRLQVDQPSVIEVVHRIAASPEPELSPTARELLVAAVTAGKNPGTIIDSTTLQGTQIIVGFRSDFFEEGDARATARYRKAIKELMARGLLNQEIDKPAWKEYGVTDDGYVLADELAAPSSA